MSYKNHLHIVSFDNPFPPNYGGVIDVYYKLKALQEQGIQITLHAFEYGRKPSPELNAICARVIYYQRRNFVNPFLGSLPYIVSTRNSEELLHNLLKDNAPILFEGLHTCYYLNHPKLAHRNKLVRMHNIEHEYYEKLEEVEKRFFKKYFFTKEAARLKTFEKTLKHAQSILAISPNDKQTLAKRFKHVTYLPAFHANSNITSQVGKGNFVLYHGKLSVGENEEAATYLVEKVFSQLKVKCIIAGDRLSIALKSKIANFPHIEIQENLPTTIISGLIQDAQINILPTFQATGIKLKLINVLYQGRFVIANDLMVANTGLQDLCIRANTPEEMILAIQQTMELTFKETNIQQRAEVLQKSFNNTANATKLIQKLG